MAFTRSAADSGVPKLAAEILTPALHAELLKVAPAEGGPEDESPHASPRDSGSAAGAGAKS